MLDPKNGYIIQNIGEIKDQLDLFRSPDGIKRIPSMFYVPQNLKIVGSIQLSPIIPEDIPFNGVFFEFDNINLTSSYYIEVKNAQNEVINASFADLQDFIKKDAAYEEYGTSPYIFSFIPPSFFDGRLNWNNNDSGSWSEYWGITPSVLLNLFGFKINARSDSANTTKYLGKIRGYNFTFEDQNIVDARDLTGSLVIEVSSSGDGINTIYFEDIFSMITASSIPYTSGGLNPFKISVPGPKIDFTSARISWDGGSNWTGYYSVLDYSVPTGFQVFTSQTSASVKYYYEFSVLNVGGTPNLYWETENNDLADRILFGISTSSIGPDMEVGRVEKFKKEFWGSDGYAVSGSISSYLSGTYIHVSSSGGDSGYTLITGSDNIKVLCNITASTIIYPWNG